MCGAVASGYTDAEVRQFVERNRRPYPKSQDMVWLACDRGGRLGAFVTAELGPIPIPALMSDSPAVEEIEEIVLSLPRVSDVASEPGCFYKSTMPASFLDLAARGLFVYDWTDVHRTTSYLLAYERVATPTRPLLLETLRHELMTAMRPVRFGVLEFCASLVVDPHAHTPCATP